MLNEGRDAILRYVQMMKEVAVDNLKPSSNSDLRYLKS
jgi:hypothetical protein